MSHASNQQTIRKYISDILLFRIMALAEPIIFTRDKHR